MEDIHRCPTYDVPCELRDDSPLLRHFLIPFSRLPSRHGAAALDLVKTRGDVWCRCLTAALLVSRGTRNDSTFTAVALAQPPLSPNLPVGAAAAQREPPLYIRACGRHVRALRPEQSTCAAILGAALPPAGAASLPALRASGALNSMEGRRGCCMGLHCGLGGVAEALAARAARAVSGARPQAVLLEEGAEPLGGVLARLLGGAAAAAGDAGGGSSGARPPPPTALIFVLGDNEGLSAAQEGEAAGALAACGVPLARASLGPTELLASQAIVLAHYELDRAVGASEVAKRAFDPADRYADQVRPCHLCAPEHPDLLLPAGPGGVA